MKERALQISNMREVLKINENIRLKLMRYNFDLNYDEEDAPNELVLMCLAVAFPHSVCLVDHQSEDKRNREKHATLSKDVQNNIKLKTNENISQEQLIDEIYLFLSPNKPIEIHPLGKTLVEVIGEKNIIEKLCLEVRHKPKFKCSPAFYKVLEDRRKIK